MRMNCEVIQDLIPVYHDGIASDATCREMRIHLKNCTVCRGYYAQYKRSMQLELAADHTPQTNVTSEAFASLSRRVRRRRLLSTASVSTIGAAAAAIAVFCVCRELQRMTKE